MLSSKTYNKDGESLDSEIRGEDLVDIQKSSESNSKNLTDNDALDLEVVESSNIGQDNFESKVVRKVGRPKKGHKLKGICKESVADVQISLVQDFDIFNIDRELIVNHIIELGKNLPEMPSVNKTDNALVYGCMSQVWVSYVKSKTTVKYLCYSDSDFIKGLLSLMMRVLNEQPYDEIIDAELYFISQIGLLSILGRQRSLGLANIIKQFKMIAVIEKNRPRHGRKPKKV